MKTYSKVEGLALIKAAQNKKEKNKKKRNNEEHELQKVCVNWFRTKYKRYRRLLFAIPNGARLYGDAKQRAIQWKKLEAEGAVPGAADLFLSVPSGDLNGLYIEMKTPSGTQSDTQKDFELDVVNVGYGYAMPRSFKEFEQVVESYLEDGSY